MKKTRILIAALLLVTSQFGCSGRQPLGHVVKLSQTRPALPQLSVVNLEVPRGRFLAALANESLTSRIRLVQVWESAVPAGQEIREYRLFGIDPRSVYPILGLENADILVAANDYVLFNPQRFKDFVRLLASEKEASIELRRDRRPILYKYTFVDAASGTSLPAETKPKLGE